jgi:hypothetical protein
MPTLRGSCHCGQLRLLLETQLSPEQLPVRECQCTFCRRHQALSTSDPAGRIVIEVGAPSLTTRYRFGLRSADFMICARCGVYVGAVMHQDGVAYAVLNVRAFDDAARFTQPPQPMDYDGEDLAARKARRLARWTPATVQTAPSAT